MMYGLIQATILTVVIAFSLVQLARKVMPQTVHALQARTARTLRHAAVPAVLRAVGERLQPAEVPAKGCGDTGGCGSCNMCGTLAALTQDIPKA